MDLEELNHRLKQDKAGVQIKQRGKLLSLVATLPPKPKSLKQFNHQQVISLGILANNSGLKQAYLEAKKLSILISQDKFFWDQYLDTPKEKTKTIGDWIEDFKKEYFSIKEETPQTLLTWNNEYNLPLKGLPKKEFLTLEALKEALLKTNPNTRTRRRYTLAYCKFLDFVGIDSKQLKKYLGNYSTKSVKPKILPTDKEIAEIRETIPNQSWKLAFGLQATYGLRNHEIFLLDFSDFPLIFINKGKTTERYTFPLYPEWATEWDLNHPELLPKISGKNNSEIGNRVYDAFQRYGIPFNPYSLRHSWAVRSIDFGLDISLASKQMGHSLEVHCKVYHQWISKEFHLKAIQRLLGNPSRPLPPVVE